MKNLTEMPVDFKSGFLDTNVLVYAHDPTDQDKNHVAKSIIRSWLDGREIWISSQVLQEFANVLINKFDSSPEETLELIHLHSIMGVFVQQIETIERAVEICKTYQTSYYDALIIAAAEAAHCDVLFTEDMQDGRTIAGVRIVNPFRGL